MELHHPLSPWDCAVWWRERYGRHVLNWQLLHLNNYCTMHIWLVIIFVTKRLFSNLLRHFFEAFWGWYKSTTVLICQVISSVWKCPENRRNRQLQREDPLKVSPSTLSINQMWPHLNMLSWWHCHCHKKKKIFCKCGFSWYFCCIVASYTNDKQVSHIRIITDVPFRFPFTSVCVVFL